MAIEAKDLVVAVKAYSRSSSLPLDATEVYSTLGEAESYSKSPTAYAGQTIKVLQNGEYVTYVLNQDGDSLVLKKVGAGQSETKNYVQVVSTLPFSGQEQGVVYINSVEGKGYIYNGAYYQLIFEDVTTLKARVDTLETQSLEYARLDGATFTGTVTLDADPSVDMGAATKQYVDRLISGVNSPTIGIVDSSNSLPSNDYQVGETYRVTEDGIYAGKKCEVGDLIIVIKDFDTVYSDSDFLIVQANIDGAVTGPNASTDANIVIFDGLTGKKIQDSTVTLASLQDTIAKAHTHTNKEKLDTYTQTQTELLASAADSVDIKLAPINTTLTNKVDTATLGGYYTKIEVDDKLTPITTNLNSKVDVAYVSGVVGEIGEENTVKTYVDTAIIAVNTNTDTKISTAKTEAITDSTAYTDSSLTITEF